MKNIIQTQNAPAAIGPYSQAVQVGSILFLSGQIPIDPQTSTVVAGDISEQTHQVMKNIGQVLSAAGAGYGHVVKTTLYIADMNYFAQINEVYGKYFDEQPPARSTVEVARLPKDVGIEIEAIAKLEA